MPPESPLHLLQKRAWMAAAAVAAALVAFSLLPLPEIPLSWIIRALAVAVAAGALWLAWAADTV